MGDASLSPFPDPEDGGLLKTGTNSSYLAASQEADLPAAADAQAAEDNFERGRHFLSFRMMHLPDLGILNFDLADADLELRYLEAAIYLEEGLKNERLDFHPKDVVQLRYYKLIHNVAYNVLELVVAILFLATAIYYQPYLARSDWDYVVIGCEAGCLIFFAIEFLINFRWVPLKEVLKYPMKAMKLMVLFLTMIALLLMLVDSYTDSDKFFIPVTVIRSLRPVVLLDCYYCSSLRRVLRQIMQTIPIVFEFVCLLFGFLVVFAILALFLFAQIDPARYGSLSLSFINLFILLTTANFPDVMMECYSKEPAAPIFFISYLCIELYFMMNLFLAVVYDIFSEKEQEKFKKLVLHREKSSRLAFRTVIVEDEGKHLMDFKSFKGIMKHFRPSMSPRDVMLLFISLDKDCDRMITWAEFYDIYTFFDLSWKPLKGEIFWFDRLPIGESARGFFKVLNVFTRGDVCKHLFNAVIIANFVALFAFAIIASHEYDMQASHGTVHPDFTKDPLKQQLTYIQSIFTLIYLVEVLVKLPGMGPRLYFSGNWNLFDFALTCAGVAYSSYYFNAKAHENVAVAASILILRMVRLVRVVNIKDSLANIMATAAVLGRTFVHIGGVVCCIYYFYGEIGMASFGTLTQEELQYCCPNEPYGGEWETDHYYLNNFNTLPRAYVTLFELTIVNNWYVILYGYIAAKGHRAVASYFIIFFVLMMIVTTVLVSFILDTFLYRMKDFRTGKKDDEGVLPDPLRLQLQKVVEVLYKDFDDCLEEEERDQKQMDKLYPKREQSAVARFIGARSRRKEDYNNLQYADEIQEWFREAEDNGDDEEPAVLSAKQKAVLESADDNNVGITDGML